MLTVSGRVPRRRVGVDTEADELPKPGRGGVHDRRGKCGEGAGRGELAERGVRAPHPVCTGTERDAVDHELRACDDVVDMS